MRISFAKDGRVFEGFWGVVSVEKKYYKSFTTMLDGNIFLLSDFIYASFMNTQGFYEKLLIVIIKA